MRRRPGVRHLPGEMMNERRDDPSPSSAAASASAEADAERSGLLDAEAPTEFYRVLARKYRPRTFAELIGQEAMVRTLTNAFAAGRIAHAFILTGVRGVGKTSTARIIAKGLNCTGPDGTGGPTIAPCCVCDNCRTIAEDRHVDVIEMDAASHTGVDDIREILDGVRYRPIVARTKVYIIDEVHMLSKHAFNALLKTLEEPPEHVKFVFATTEIRKVPVTVLSRCQRFDLRRVAAETLVEHLAGVAKAEGAQVAPEALAMIARAADGSVRDAQSLLDQAIAHGAGAVEAAAVRDMLGLADAAKVFDLMDALLRGDAKAALDLLGELYAAGADPLTVMQDLLDLTHWLTRLIVAPEAAVGPATSEVERERGREMAGKLSLPILGRAWQMLMKGLGEVQAAPAPLAAAEMAVVRLCYAAELPTPGELVKRLQAGAPAPGDGGGSVAVAGGARAVPEAAPQTVPDRGPPEPTDFRALVELFAGRGDLTLRNHLYHNVHLVSLEPGRLKIRLTPEAPSGLPGEVLKRLRRWLGPHWNVLVATDADGDGESTLAAEDRTAEEARRSGALQHPIVKAVLDAFPGAEVTRVRPLDRAGAVGEETTGGGEAAHESGEEGGGP